MSKRQSSSPDVRLLTYTNLYPSAELPRHGIFVEERLRHLVATGRVAAEVCALRPRNTLNPLSFFGEAPYLGTETRHGVEISYMAVPTLPLITNWVDPVFWARATRRFVKSRADSQPRGLVLDTHFLYPDAVAAAILGRRLGLPVVMTARGSDVNVKCESAVMRRWVCWAARQCAAVITVSQALANKLIGFGVSPDKVHVLPNGVDLDKFRPQPREHLPAELSAVGGVLLSAGHLVEGKGHHIAIEALTGLAEVTLLIVGEGPEEARLRRLADELGVSSRVRFLGYVPHEKMADTYGAADFTVLASANEGMPNVMLESLACGTRVVATDVGGVGEVLTAPVAGAIMTSRSADAVIESVRMLSKTKHEREETRLFAEQFDWDVTVQRQLLLYEQLVSR